MNIGCTSRGPTILVVCGDIFPFIVTLAFWVAVCAASILVCVCVLSVDWSVCRAWCAAYGARLAAALFPHVVCPLCVCLPHLSSPLLLSMSLTVQISSTPLNDHTHDDDVPSAVRPAVARLVLLPVRVRDSKCSEERKNDYDYNNKATNYDTTTTTTKPPTTTTTTTTTTAPEAPSITTTEAPNTTTTRAPSHVRRIDGSLGSSAWACAPLLLAASALAYTTLG
ncbi:hypothetical protein ECC02_013638 [Trypanosoma cruzi]|uniref:Mucin TcMUCII n=1 Tax=Trypanosoma cruzi TaxID=5693 RepID=A0A7J6XH67_TRYCR|nr:hypothetical protein ECC02_013638 [Trypanosoma cruzi]